MQALEELRDDLQSRDKRIVNATAFMAQVKSCELFVNRTRRLYQQLPRTQMVAQVVLRDNNDSARLHGGHCYLGGYEHAHFKDAAREHSRSGCRTDCRDARLTPGKYDCIF